MNVIDLRYLDGYRLRLTFSDGTWGNVDLKDEVFARAAFKPLTEPETFRRAFIEDGTVCWPGQLDLAPERLYALAHELPPPATFEDAQRNELDVSLRELRQLSERRQEDLAGMLEITQGAISRLEGAAADAKLATIRRYVSALGWNLEVVAVKGDKRFRLRGV
jgi:hypothetical protein